MDETIVRIAGGNCYGILTHAAQPAADRTTLVLLNAGLIHRVGPFRSSVHIARKVAGQGHDVFRFDIPRVGDGTADGKQSLEQCIRSAFDSITQATGSRRFAIGGICSGADTGWRIACQDPRVAGVWLFDGFAARGKWFKFGRMQRALRRPPWQWPALALRMAQGRTGGLGGVQVSRDWSSPGQFREEAATLLGRGVRILAIYTGGVSKYLIHPNQIDDTFGQPRGRDGLDIEFWPDLDHILLSTVDRDRVVERVAEWCAGF